jgi:hypothetical protein
MEESLQARLKKAGSILSGGYRAVANYKIHIIQYGGISSRKAPSSMEAEEQLQIIRFP